MEEGEEELWDPEGSKTLGEHGPRESTKQGSWVLTKTEGATTEHTGVCGSALGPLLTLRLFAWCLVAAPDRGEVLLTLLPFLPTVLPRPAFV